MSEYVDKFCAQHKTYFKRNRDVIENTSWGLEVDITKKTKEFKLENELAQGILGRLSAFIEDASGDRNLKKTQDFIESTVEIIDTHLKNCDNYLDYKLDSAPEKDSEEDIDLKIQEIAFQNNVFKEKIKIENTLSGLNIHNSSDNLHIKFFKDQKASLLMKEALTLRNNDIRLMTDNLSVDWNIRTSNQMLFNMNPKDIPQWNQKKHYWEQDSVVLQFWAEEFNKITKGITINGYFVHPFLYWHLNIFKTPIPQKDGTEPTINPYHRDNEDWFIENLKRAEDAKNRGMLLFGTRRFTKSVLLASYIQWKSHTKFNSVATVTGGSEGDLADLTNKIKTSMFYTPPAFKLELQKQEWESGTTTLGIKEDASNIIQFSAITVRNLAAGAKSATQRLAGGAPSAFVNDEALHKDTLLYKKNSNVAIKDIKVGDKIFGADGKLTKVLEKHKFKNRQLYKITFSDGREIECCENHLWEVQDVVTKKISVKSTGEILEKYRWFQKDKRYDDKEAVRATYSIKLNAPIKYDKLDLPVDPYYMGMYIGDGLCGNTSIVTADKEIEDSIIKYAEELGMTHTFKTPPFKNVRIVNIIDPGRRDNRLRDKLRELGTFDSKHINELYERGSIEQRLEFLRGIIDTDGEVNVGGAISVCTSVEDIKDSVVRIARSLGIRVKVGSRIPFYTKGGERHYCKFAYRIYLYTNLELCKLERKRERLVQHYEGKAKFYRERINIVDIQKSRIDDAYCIKVDNEDKLFIAGDYIVTHNCGKYDFLKSYLAAIPSFETPYGYKCVPIIAGTSGESDLSKDAMTVLSQPEKYNLLPMDWDLLEDKIDPEFHSWKKRNFSIFAPGQMAYKDGFLKIEKPLDEYLGIKNAPELNKLTIQVTDWGGNLQKIKDWRAEAKGDSLLLQQRVLQYPISPEECFLSAEKNIFNYEEAMRRKEYLEQTGEWDRRFELFRDYDGKIKKKPSNKPLAEYPHKGGNIDAPHLIFEDFPEEKQPLYTYVAGGDFFKQESSDTDSVGTIYIYKYDILGDKWAYRLVASYSSRPGTFNEFYKNCLMLLEAYNAVLFPENEDLGGFQSFLEKQHLEEYYLMPHIDFTSTLEFSVNGRRKWGWTSAQSKRKLLNMFANYTKEDVKVINELGEEVSMERIHTINDIYLLDEIINFTINGNYDRITASMGAIGFLHYLEKNYISPKRFISQKDTETNISKRERNPYSSTTGRTRSPYSRRR